MSEKVDFKANTYPGKFLISAITQGKVIDEIIKRHVPGEPFDIQLTINGVEVPFVVTMNDLWARAQAEIENKARQMAKEMITEAGLNNIREILQQFEYELKDAIDNVKLK